MKNTMVDYMKAKSIVLKSWEEVEEVAFQLQLQGWETIPCRSASSGQEGFRCVVPISQENGQVEFQETHVVWNIYGKPLDPISIPCESDGDFFSFLVEHGKHGLEVSDKEDKTHVICQCRSAHGLSTILEVPKEFSVLWEEILQGMKKKDPQEEDFQVLLN